MKTVLRKSAVQILLGLVVALTLFLPGLLFNLFAETPLTWFELKYLWMFWAFGIVLCACPSFRLSATVLTGLAVLELTQFASLAFTHEYITPFSIGLMLIEYLDVAESTVANSVHFLHVPLVVLLPYLLCLEILRRTWSFSFKSRWFLIFVIAFLAFPLVRIKTHTDRDDFVNFFPTARNPTLVNTLNSYSLYFGVLLPESLFGGTVKHQFPEYEIRETDIPPSPLTVVLVMGESLTPNHMSLYGYGRKTTPFLEEMAGDPDFVHRKGYAAANATRAALPMFYTLQYHPLDENRLRRQDSNLFLLAKQHGFRTWYLSAQNSNCLNGVNLDSIDVMITADTEPELFEREKDEGLLQLVRKVPAGGKNFIVVHQRNVHLPYQANIEHRPAFHRFPTEDLPFEESTINAYDNAVLYADDLYRQLLRELREKTEGPLYVVMTSDHGENLGENGHWGHDRLDLVSAVVPIMFYARGGDGRYLREMREHPPGTHYQLGKMIARMLGYDIRNPAEEDGIVYVNGVASLGRSGYMRFRVTDDGERRDLRVIQSPFAAVEGDKSEKESGTSQSIPR
ncbi:phosphoethanolamine transferase [Desulfoprunum benzoelyticum]|uniref:Glucan phosphoethanolaminetransferase (Alkaline phosphatase superfamily) n=1 Tax=Desulfoprunum benzoelyticum TaxID=1506996 RepID=A0A840UR81_9BACT|nr:phosphoethanolamine transferase [Desulfoprunum benzoelyticum]MBB5348155.1 glucan phosphoethanolaminetransferase (alkaline phosphatase superfamily) [Desulfoprunum benzoelyticum]MBM9530235.1 phosphoethanolamine transferase [Desulfoprunum benzoelyticum]